MATNLVATSVYQINQRVIPLANVTQIGFPTQGCVVLDCFASPTRALSTGVSVYAAIVTPDGNKNYVTQTIAQVVTLFNT